MPADLVDYLRDKLAEAACTCRWANITSLGDRVHTDLLLTSDCLDHPTWRAGYRRTRPRTGVADG